MLIHTNLSKNSMVPLCTRSVFFFAASSLLLLFWLGPACNTFFTVFRDMLCFKRNKPKNSLILLPKKGRSKEKGKVCSFLSLILLKQKLSLWSVSSISSIICASLSVNLCDTIKAETCITETWAPGNGCYAMQSGLEAEMGASFLKLLDVLIYSLPQTPSRICQHSI